MATGFTFDPAQLTRFLTEKQQRMQYAVETAGRVGAAQMQRAAQVGAPWTDRSGFARRSIKGDMQRTAFGARITLSGNVYYSVYLELAMKKRWAILWPTINKMGPDIIRQIARITL